MENELDELVADKEKIRKSIREELDSIREAKQQALSDAIKTKKAVQAKDRKLHSAEKIMSKKQNRIDALQQKSVDEATRSINEERNNEDGEVNQDKINKFKKQIDKIAEKQNKLFEKKSARIA